jgi:hypothetical protein
MHYYSGYQHLPERTAPGDGQRRGPLCACRVQTPCRTFLVITSHSGQYACQELKEFSSSGVDSEVHQSSCQLSSHRSSTVATSVYKSRARTSTWHQMIRLRPCRGYHPYHRFYNRFVWKETNIRTMGDCMLLSKFEQYSIRREVVKRWYGFPSCMSHFPPFIILYHDIKCIYVLQSTQAT